MTADGLHVPITNATACTIRNPETGHGCTRARGHTGRHAFVWQHLSPGRVREVWE